MEIKIDDYGDSIRLSFEDDNDNDILIKIHGCEIVEIIRPHWTPVIVLQPDEWEQLCASIMKSIRKLEANDQHS